MRQEYACWVSGLVGAVLLTGTVCQVRGGATITEIHGFDNHFNPSSLLQTEDGSFYGTIAGATNCGMIFRIAPNGSLSSFASLNGKNGCPFEGGPLVKGLDGNLYGTTFAGGSNVFCRGTIFRLATNGILTTLASFNGTNGWQPEAGLVLGTDGDFYGTTAYGGAGYKQGMITPELAPGTVFKISATGQFMNLVSFNRTNGASPSARLVEGRDGNFYGTTVAGGPSELGSAFRMRPDGTLTTLTFFNGSNGSNPYGGLVFGSDGNLYGTTAHGGANGFGTVFRLTPNGLLTTLASFQGTDGAYPFSGLVQGTDGILYGTTLYGGIGYNGSINTGYGAVFGITPAGVFTTLALFEGVNGAHPLTELIQGADGGLYGTTSGGGSHGAGNVYRVDLPIAVHLVPQVGNNFLMTWNAVTGRTYQVQYKSEFTQTNWIDTGSALTATNTVAAKTDLLATEPQRFYRVIELH